MEIDEIDREVDTRGDKRRNADCDRPTAGQVRFSAMTLLAQREHSRFELQRKLSRRYPGDPLIETVIQQLADESLQSDARFAEQFVAMRIRKGQGPTRIENELQQRRVDPCLIAECLQPFANQWPELAHAALKKKYKQVAPSGAEKAKQIRFLLYRGFTHDHVLGLWREG